MKSIADCRVLVAGLVALSGLVQGVSAKTIVVNSYGAAVFVSPGKYLVNDHALPVSRADARLRSVFAAIGATTATARMEGHDSDSTPVEAGFGPSGLYKEARWLAQNGGYTWSASAVGKATSMSDPAPQGNFLAMLLVGAALVAHQLRRKHRSLKQSLIAG